MAVPQLQINTLSRSGRGQQAQQGIATNSTDDVSITEHSEASGSASADSTQSTQSHDHLLGAQSQPSSARRPAMRGNNPSSSSFVTAAAAGVTATAAVAMGSSSSRGFNSDPLSEIVPAAGTINQSPRVALASTTDATVPVPSSNSTRIVGQCLPPVPTDTHSNLVSAYLQSGNYDRDMMSSLVPDELRNSRSGRSGRSHVVSPRAAYYSGAMTSAAAIVATHEASVGAERSGQISPRLQMPANTADGADGQCIICFSRVSRYDEFNQPPMNKDKYQLMTFLKHCLFVLYYTGTRLVSDDLWSCSHVFSMCLLSG
jgi:hypothetical protein